jgi:twitching motility protein PilT
MKLRIAMKPEIRWLARLALDQNLLRPDQCRSLREALGPQADFMDFAQKIIDDGLVSDVALLEKLAGLAVAKGQKGVPLEDPFAEETDASPTTAPARPRGLSFRATGQGQPAPAPPSFPAAQEPKPSREPAKDP